MSREEREAWEPRGREQTEEKPSSHQRAESLLELRGHRTKPMNVAVLLHTSQGSVLAHLHPDPPSSSALDNGWHYLVPYLFLNKRSLYTKLRLSLNS